MTRVERHADLQEKVEDLKEKYEAAKRRREKWEAYKKQMGQSKAATSYEVLFHTRKFFSDAATSVS